MMKNKIKKQTISNGVIKFVSMGKLRVLYISYDGLTDALGQSQVLPYLINLARLKYEITILSTEKEDNFLKNKLLISKICSDNGIKWEYISYTKKPPILSTLIDVSKLKKKVKALNTENKFQIVHCRSYIAALVGMAMKVNYGTKFLFDIRGFWADERVDGNIWNLKIPVFKWVYSYFKKKERAFFLSADASVSLTFNGKKEILSWEYMKGKKGNIYVIPCCADLNHFDYTSNKREFLIKKKLGIEENHKVICYLGSIGTWYMMDEMLDYFKVHLTKHPESIFLWITKDNPDEIFQAAKKKGIDKNIKVTSSERKELPQVLSICDASIFFIKPLYSKKASSPTKMAELLGMGIPLICNSNVGDTDEIVAKESVGLVVKDFSDDEYNIIVEKFDTLINTDKTHLRNVAKEYFSLEQGVKNYSSIYESLSK